MTRPSRHTPEPWAYSPYHRAIIEKARSVDGCSVVAARAAESGAPGTDLDIGAHNAARIVACVNYCAGLDNDQLGPLTALEYIGELESRAENAEAKLREYRLAEPIGRSRV